MISFSRSVASVGHSRNEKLFSFGGLEEGPRCRGAAIAVITEDQGKRTRRVVVLRNVKKKKLPDSGTSMRVSVPGTNAQAKEVPIPNQQKKIRRMVIFSVKSSCVFSIGRVKKGEGEFEKPLGLRVVHLFAERGWT